MGRRKLEIKPITDKISRQVTFSKRKAGLFNKASELASLCSAEICIIVFSPGGRAFHYAFPDADTVIARFLNEDREVVEEEEEEASGEGGNESELKEYNDELAAVLERSRLEKRKGVRLDRAVKKFERDMKLEELEEVRRSMEKLMEAIAIRVSEIDTEMEVSSSLLLLAEGDAIL